MGKEQTPDDASDPEHAEEDTKLKEGSDGSVSESDEARCGYGRFSPDWLQAFNNPKGLLSCICLFVFVEGFLVNGINNVNVSTLERRFDLPSARVAWISSSNDLTGGAACLVFGYLGMFVHKGRALTVTAACMALGAFIMFLPHLLAGPYQLYGLQSSTLCQDNASVEAWCESASSGSHDNHYLYVFIVGMSLVGIGGSTVFLLGTTWIDDNVKQQNTPVYIGIMHAFAALGPAVGFVAGGLILNIYVDLTSDMAEIADLSPSDPRWVGAWWIGFLVSSIGGALVVFFIACFPAILPGVKRRRHTQAALSKSNNPKSGSVDELSGSHQGVVGTLSEVLTNPSWIITTVIGIVESGTIVAFNTFLPKMFQFQFGLTASQAAMLTGAVVVPGAAVGQVIGGLIPKWADLRLRGLFVQCGVCSMICALLSPILLLRCQMPKIAGVTTPYYHDYMNGLNSTYVDGDLDHPCNADCGCTTTSYEPVCDDHSGVEYFSPCHAGCLATVTNQTTEQTTYHNCSCVHGAAPSDEGFNAQQPWSSTVQDGPCQHDCNKLYVFLPAFFVVVVTLFISETATHVIILRCVPFRTRSLAYGVQSSIVRLIGSVSGPLLLGVLFDKACLVWKSDCGTVGSCWVYDNGMLSWRLFLIFSCMGVACGALYFLGAVLVGRSRDVKLSTMDELAIDVKIIESEVES